jgi:hypothetical protein
LPASQMRLDTRSKSTSSRVQRPPAEARRVIPRSTARFEMAAPKRSRSAPRVGGRVSSAAKPQMAPPSKRLSGSRQSSSEPARHSSAASLRASPSRERATTYRRSGSSDARTSAQRQEKTDARKNAVRSARRRSP